MYYFQRPGVLASERSLEIRADAWSPAAVTFLLLVCLLRNDIARDLQPGNECEHPNEGQQNDQHGGDEQRRHEPFTHADPEA